MDDSIEIAPGTLIDDKFRLKRPVGFGGMGTVYEAVQIAISRPVAIKLLHPKYTGDPHVVQRFHQEARAAGSIGHHNICEVTDMGITDDGAPYLVMPLLVGSSLADIMKRGLLPLDRLVRIICQILEALQAAHDAGIVHRDLKPGNIFITQMGDLGDFVKLLDFGISKVLDQDSDIEDTKTGTVLGTPHYMSPEQARGSKDIDHRVDIYATGVILYEALTGRHPFVGDSHNEIMFNIIATPCLTPRTIIPSIPKVVERVLLMAMDRDPAARFESADEMRAILEEAHHGEPVSRPKSEKFPDPDGANLADTQSSTALTTVTDTDGSISRRNTHRGRTRIIAIAAFIGMVAIAVAILGISRTDEPVPNQVEIVPMQPANPKINVPSKPIVPTIIKPEIVQKPEVAIGETENKKENKEENKSKPKKKKKKPIKKNKVNRDKTVKQKKIQPKPKNPDVVKGRFDTVIFSEYE